MERTRAALTRWLALVGFVVVAAAQAATITVTGTGDTVAADGSVTLREAIASINAGANINADVVAVGAYGSSDTIAFNIAGGCATPCQIDITGLFITISAPMVIDGTTQPGAAVNTLALGDNAVQKIVIAGNGFGTVLFQVTGGGTTFRGLVINGVNNDAIQFSNSSNNVVEGCFLGTNAAGTTAIGNTRAINVVGGSNIRIGGTAPAQRNILSGNGTGIGLSGGGSGLLVQGNYIGPDVSGNVALFQFHGIEGDGLAQVTIGGTVPGAGNVVSGNIDNGISLSGIAANPLVLATIQGNIVGLNAAGTAALGNGLNGIGIGENSANGLGTILIGGTAAGAGNVISGNGFGFAGSFSGIFTYTDNSTVTIQGNLIGTNVAGTVGIGNDRGITTDGDGALLGNTIIGGAAPGSRNVIAASNGDAIHVAAGNATITGNFIGTASDGASALPTGGTGVFIIGAAAVVGGTGAGEGNVIANSGAFGVVIGSGPTLPFNGKVLGNSIYNSTTLGIDIFGNGVTPNDLGDGDTGPNGLQNFPILTSAAIAAGIVTIDGTLNSTANTPYRIEFFSNVASHPSGHGEGKTFLGAATGVTTDGSGNASFGPLTFAIPPGETVISSTATDPAGNTSEFSADITAGAGASADVAITKAGSASVLAGGNLTYTIAVSNAGPAAAASVAVSDTLPAGTTFVSLTGPAGWTFTTPAVGSGGTITATNASLANGANAAFTLIVNVGAGVAAGTVISNTATATAATADPAGGNNSATAVTTVAAPSADLGVGLFASPNPVVAGADLTYSITVTNAGPSAAASVVLSESIPANATFVSLTGTGGWTLTTPAVGGTGAVTATLASLASGSTANFTLVVNVDAAVVSGTVITDTASISATTADPNAGNNSAVANVAVGLVSSVSKPIPALSDLGLALLAIALAAMAIQRIRRENGGRRP